MSIGFIKYVYQILYSDNVILINFNCESEQHSFSNLSGAYYFPYYKMY